MNLLHEMLQLSIKLDQYNEEWFKEYLDYPLERCDHFLKKQLRERN